jgi:hypothetical protein
VSREQVLITLLCRDPVQRYAATKFNRIPPQRIMFTENNRRLGDYQAQPFSLDPGAFTDTYSALGEHLTLDERIGLLATEEKNLTRRRFQSTDASLESPFNLLGSPGCELIGLAGHWQPWCFRRLLS